MKLRAEPRLVPSILQATAILRALALAGRPLALTALSRALGISPSSCYNVLKTLLAEDLVAFDEATKLYSTGLGLVRLARHALQSDEVVAAAVQEMKELARGTSGTFGLWRQTSAERLLLTCAEQGGGDTRIHMAEGQRQPVGGGAVGRMALALMLPSQALIARRFAAVRWGNAPDFETYKSEVKSAWDQGKAFDRDTLFPGITTLAVPITGLGETRRYFLSFSDLSPSLDEDRLIMMEGWLEDLARRIQRKTDKVLGDHRFERAQGGCASALTPEIRGALD